MIPVQKWVFSQRGLNPAERLLLLYYCARANGDLTCFPSFSTTATECELGRRYVIRTTRKVLCEKHGLMSVITEPAARTAILAKAGARDNCRANVYRINFITGTYDGAHRTPSDSAHRAPSQANGAHRPPSEADLLALVARADSAHRTPSGPTDGAHRTPTMVLTGPPGWGPEDTHDGAHRPPESITEKRESELRADAEAPTRVAGAAADAPDGRSGVAAPQEAETEPPTEPAATTGGGAVDAPLAKAPALGAGAASPTQGLRKPGAPPDPFDEWLDQGAPADRALAAAIARPKPRYAPPEVLKAARQRLAQRAASLADA